MESDKYPLYQQISQDLIKRINSGEFKKGSLMMSEMDVQKEYNVSRVTARNAFKTLIGKGILRTIQGKGTYVNDIDTRDWTWMSSFSQQVLQAGHTPSTRMINFKVICADANLAQHLQVPIGEACFYLKRVRYIDNRPVWLTKSFLPCSLAPSLTADFFSVAGVCQSIFKVLELNFGIKTIGGEELHEAINISEKDAVLLGIQTNRPVIFKAFVANGINGLPIVYENTVFEQSISKNYVQPGEMHRII